MQAPEPYHLVGMGDIFEAIHELKVAEVVGPSLEWSAQAE